MDKCVFCSMAATEILCENELAKAFYDGFPVNEGHVLVVPKRHVATYFEASREEIEAMNDLIVEVKELLDEKYRPDGYNIGFNVGEAAGQTVFHLHVHIIPRYVGDVKNPRGGVRKVKNSVVPYPAEEGSGEKVYNKLVRDKIPEIIRSTGKEPVIRIAGDHQYKRLLQQKMWEEVEEFMASGKNEELADILEVVKALAAVQGIGWEELEALTDTKAEQRGGFSKRVVLERVIDADQKFSTVLAETDGRTVRTGCRYIHYKGNEYIVLMLARHSETLEDIVVYQDCSDVSKVWVRPLSMFLEKVTVNGELVDRFREVKE